MIFRNTRNIYLVYLNGDIDKIRCSIFKYMEYINRLKVFKKFNFYYKKLLSRHARIAALAFI